MDEQQFTAALDHETSDRINYGNMIGEIKTLFMDMGEPTMWLHGAVEHWHEVDEDKIPIVGESIKSISEIVNINMATLLKIIQKHAKYLFGEEFSDKSFHASDCECSNNHEEEL
jgi:hypothetical protein